MTLLHFLLIGALVTVFSVVLGAIVWKVRDKVDDWEDETQRHINKIENQFAAAGVTGWFPTFLEDLVVGDEEAVVRDARQMLEAEDTAGFFLQNVALPVALYAIRQGQESYPDVLAKLQAALAKTGTAAPPVAVAPPATTK